LLAVDRFLPYRAVVDADKTSNEVDQPPADARPAPEPRSETDLLPFDEAPAEPVVTLGRRRRSPAGGAGTPETPTPSRAATEMRTTDFRTAARQVAEPTVPTNIYRARRPAMAAVVIVPAVFVGMLLIRALAIAAFGRPFNTGGVIASSLALASLPLLVAGLYGLLTGAAHGAEHFGFKVWARPPLAYLVVGLAFAAAAGLAIS
jgi:hypothetical protein